MCQHCEFNHHGNSGLVSELSTQSSWQLWPLCQHCQLNHHGNSGPCVSIVNSIIMASLAFLSALPMSAVMTTLAHASALSTQSSWQLWPCVSIVNSIIVATLVHVLALSAQISWHLWPMCQHCQSWLPRITGTLGAVLLLQIRQPRGCSQFAFKIFHSF